MRDTMEFHGCVADIRNELCTALDFPLPPPPASEIVEEEIAQ